MRFGRNPLSGISNPIRSPLHSQNRKWDIEKAKQRASIVKQRVTSDKVKPRVIQCKSCGRLSSPMKLSLISQMIRTKDLFCKSCGCHDFEFYRGAKLGKKKPEGKHDYVLKEKKIIKKLPLPDGGI